MRLELTGEGEYFHIYSRGVDKRLTYHATRDYERFILTMFAVRSESTVPNLSRIHSDQHLMLIKKVEEINELIEGDKRLVEIICFCLMPNHFHLILKEVVPGGISKFMQRLGNGYTKYFNKKYGRTGYLFGSSFQSIHIDHNDYLLYLSRYIHRNPKTSLRTKDHLEGYPWSSYQDYLRENRWGNGLNPAVILEQFKNQKEYQNYVKGDFEMEIDPRYLLE